MTSSVSVIGLGAMGATVARTVAAAGHHVTVWNRTPARAEELHAEAGVTVAATPAAAIEASDLTVVVLLDVTAVAAVLDAAGPSLQDATLVNLTSTTPEDARATAASATGAGARYVDGAIMVPTPLVGTEQAFVLYSGDTAVVDEYHAVLSAIGAPDVLGTDPGLAALHDLGMLDVFFAGMSSFLHAAALVGSDGVPAASFLPYAERIVDVLSGTLPGLARAVDAGAHPGDEDNLAMELAALDHVVEASEARGVDPSVPRASRSLAAAAVADGYGADGYSRIVDVLRRADTRATVSG